MPWISPYTIVLVITLTALGVLIGRIRGDSRRVAALYIIGLVVFFFGVAWSTSFGQPAFSATLVACLGAVLLALGWERSRVARSLG